MFILLIVSLWHVINEKGDVTLEIERKGEMFAQFQFRSFLNWI